MAAPSAMACLGWASTATGRPRPDDTSSDDERDPRRAADQQHVIDRVGLEARGPQRPLERGDRLGEGRSHEGLELAPGHAHLGLHVRQEHRHAGLAVERQALLGDGALLAEAGDGRQGLGVVGVEVFLGVVDRGADVAEHGGVDVDAAQALDALGRPEHREPAVGLLAEHRGVERAAAEVVHGHDRALLDPLLGGVGDGGRLRLGDEVDAGHAGDLGRLLEQVALVGPPVGGVGQHHRRRALAAAGVHGGVDDPGEQLAGEHLGRDAGLAHEQRRGVAQPPLELAGDPPGIGDGVPLGGVAGDEPAVGLQAQHRRCGRPPLAERDHLGAPLGRTLVHRRRGVRRAEIDAEEVAHPSSHHPP